MLQAKCFAGISLHNFFVSFTRKILVSPARR